MNILNKIIENEERISATDAIEFDIFRDFYRNLEHKGNHIQSFAIYNGKKVWIVFHDWKQSPLWKLADYFYKMNKVVEEGVKMGNLHYVINMVKKWRRRLIKI